MAMSNILWTSVRIGVTGRSTERNVRVLFSGLLASTAVPTGRTKATGVGCVAQIAPPSFILRLLLRLLLLMECHIEVLIEVAHGLLGVLPRHHDLGLSRREKAIC